MYFVRRRTLIRTDYFTAHKNRTQRTCSRSQNHYQQATTVFVCNTPMIVTRWKGYCHVSVTGRPVYSGMGGIALSSMSRQDIWTWNNGSNNDGSTRIERHCSETMKRGLPTLDTATYPFTASCKPLRVQKQLCSLFCRCGGTKMFAC